MPLISMQCITPVESYTDLATGFPVLRLGGAPITQGALIKMLVRRGVHPDQALHQLETIAAPPRREFWLDHVPFTEVALTGVIGHRQVTDAYLVQLARSRAGRLAKLNCNNPHRSSHSQGPGLPAQAHPLTMRRWTAAGRCRRGRTGTRRVRPTQSSTG